MVNITGWGAFWLMAGVAVIIKIITAVLVKMYYIRQIVKMLDVMIDNNIDEDELDIIRNMVDRLRW